MPQTAVIVRVPEAEPCVAGLRKRFDASALLGVPAHITILSPFVAPERIAAADFAKIEAAVQTVHAFDFELSQIARFPATTYLAPEPPTHFIALTQSLVRSFPDFPPFEGRHSSIVPHLTVANGSAEDAEHAARELELLLASHGPIRGRCASVVLLENSSGLWKEMREFALRPEAD